MAQHDYDCANANGQNFRSDLNSVLDAIHSTNSGGSEPSTTVAYMLWADTTNNLLKIRNGANNGWVSLGSINTANLGLAALASPTFTGTVTAPELDLTGTTSLKLPVGTTAQRPTGQTGDTRFNSTLSQVETYSGSTWEKVGGVPSGSIVAYPVATPPSGWLICNGQAVSRSTYATLFAVIGTTYGAGDGSSTFAVPDCRGEFIRGLDQGRNVDPSRSIGSTQADLLESHNHSVSISDPGHYHQVAYSNSDSGDGVIEESGTGHSGYEPTESATTGISASISATGGAETRPRNIAFVYIIKS
tara:strand:- start:440 stop:1345 length:906 start_codon:yes stop_codon:yes gene_type:complete